MTERIEPTLTTYASREEWLAARRQGIGGSDVPAILGLSRWSTPLKVWTEKVGLAEPQESSYVLRRGSHMEGLLAAEIAREVEASRTGILFMVEPRASFCIVRGSESWMLYSPDGFATVTDRDADREDHVLLEWKSHPKGASEWQEGVPPHVIAQVQYGMIVTDLPACYVGVDLGTEFRWAKVDRDPDWGPMNLPKLRAFWALVESETPPPAEAEDSDVLKRLYPVATRPMVMLDGECVDATERIHALGAEINRLTDEQAKLKNRVKAAIGEAEVGVLPTGGEWRWKLEHKDAYMVTAQDNRVLRWSGKKEE